jgi:CHRD domain
MAGHLFVNVHTAADPNGEIRGQMLASRLSSTQGGP